MMTASFALSIILFLCFSVGMDLAHALLPNLRSWQPDISYNGYANEAVLERKLKDEISQIPGVIHVWGSSCKADVTVMSSDPNVNKIRVISYDRFMMEAAEQSAVKGDFSKVMDDNSHVMTIFSKDNPVQVGDTIIIGETELKVICSLSDGLFSGEAVIICSQETFDRLWGKQNYTIMGVQLNSPAADSTIAALSDLAHDDVIFSDLRQSNEENISTYYTARIIVYSFLAIISMITVFNIINSISMSVSARMKLYGIMRAVGMDNKQLTQMLAAETFTYAVSGLLLGLGIGLPLSRYIHTLLITRHFGIVWSIPVTLVIIILCFTAVSASTAVYLPAKRMKNMAITETINKL